MAYSYTRQSSMSDGDTITAALFNNEYNQLVNAFAYSSSSASTTGHRHDGSAGQGGSVQTIGDLDFLNKIVADSTNNRWGVFVEVSSAAVEQIRISDGVISPVTDNDIDLGTSSLEFKDLFIDGTAHIDTLDVDVNGTVAGTFGVTGAATLSSTLAVTGAVTGSSTIQGTTITATTAFVPDASDGAALGTSALEFSDLFLADGAVINFGDDQDVSLTHVADTGLLLSSTDQLQFGDSGTYIYQSADGVLDLVSDTEIELTATTIDINGAVAMDGAITGGTNITISGELDAATLDISGNADIDVTLEADAYTVDGTALNEYIADTVGAMVGSNTETNITVTYEDGDNTLDFVIGTLNQDTTGTADNITISANNSTDETVYPLFVDGATGSQGAESDTGLTYNPSSGLLTTTLLAGTLNTAAQGNVTSLGTLTTLTVDNVIINGTTIGHTSDTDLMTLTSGVLTVAGEVDATSLDISGDADIDGTLEADAITIGGVTLAETIADTVGAMVSSNTETNITVTYEDGDNTLDFVIGTLNQDTSGTAAIATSVTASANNSTDETVYPTFVDGATGTQGIETDTGLTYNPSSGLLTISGELDAGSLDISGNADIDGTLEADAITVDGTTLAEYIADTAGAMFSSNTESGITVTYQDGDNTVDLAVDAAQTGITSLLATDIKIGEDDQTKIDFETADEIHFYAANVEQVYVADNIFGPQSDSDVDLGTTGVRWKDAFVDSITVTGEVDAASLDISGNVDIDGVLETDNLTVGGAQGSDGQVLTSTGSGVAWEDAASGGMTSFQLEDDDGTEVAISNAKEVKFIGSGVTTNWTDTSTGSDGDPYDLTFTVDAAQTGITSLLATDIKIGEDDETKIDFETADTINFYTSNAEKMRLNSSGNLLIGQGTDVGATVTPMLVVGTGATSTGSMSLFSATDGYNYIFFSDGTGGAGADAGYIRYKHDDNTLLTNRVFSGDFNDTSDEALKENISDLSGGTSIIKQLRPRSFDWKDSEKPHQTGRAGFIAQEVDDILPKEVYGADDEKAVNVTAIVAHLVKSIQELESRIETLEG